MGRKSRPGGEPRGFSTDWSSERTLADAEAAWEEQAVDADGDARCICGSEEFLLEAYMHVVNGRLDPEPVEVERLTCPACSREYEAIVAEGGRILRGDFLGYADLDDE